MTVLPAGPELFTIWPFTEVYHCYLRHEGREKNFKNLNESQEDTLEYQKETLK